MDSSACGAFLCSLSPAPDSALDIAIANGGGFHDETNQVSNTEKKLPVGGAEYRPKSGSEQ
jgi:hypothetical protein